MLNRLSQRLLAGVLAAVALPALAHPGGEHVHGFVAGLLHPVLGWDHLLAMLAVGVWSAQQGGAQRWLLPASFVTAMCVGGVLGMGGLQLAFTETAIAVSVLALGSLIALARHLAAPAAASLCALAALFHGLAHGGELPADASALGYASGFLLATAGLHLAAIGVAGLVQRRSQYGLRGFGLLLGAAGGYLLLA